LLFVRFERGDRQEIPVANTGREPGQANAAHLVAGSAVDFELLFPDGRIGIAVGSRSGMVLRKAITLASSSSERLAIPSGPLNGGIGVPIRPCFSVSKM